MTSYEGTLASVVSGDV
ncbi:unnamed protein product, partial [Rotaria sordida]